jgi:hypothetical protein
LVWILTIPKIVMLLISGLGNRFELRDAAYFITLEIEREEQPLAIF